MDTLPKILTFKRTTYIIWHLVSMKHSSANKLISSY